MHSKVRPTSKEQAEKVGKYMIRPILSLNRLSLDETKICYRSGKNIHKEERMDYLEFIVRVTSHIR